MVGCEGSTTSLATKVVDVGCKRPKIGRSGSRQVGRFKRPSASDYILFLDDFEERLG